jgi:hypothetical protein
MTVAKLAEKLNPRVHGFSPKMAALVGAMIGFDYGVRDDKGGHIGPLSITSDGFVIAASDVHESGAFLGDFREIDKNLKLLLADANLTAAERKEFNRLYKKNVLDLRK